MPEANRAGVASTSDATDPTCDVDRATAAMAQAGLSPATVAAYRGYLLRTARFTEHHGVKLLDADGALLAAYAEHAGASYISQKHLRQALRHFYGAHGRPTPALPAIDPAVATRRLAALPDPRCVLEAAVADGGRRGLALALVVGCGLTTEAVAALRFDQLGPGPVIRLGERHRVVEVALHPVAAALLDELRGQGDFVFVSHGRSGHVHRDTVMGWLAECCVGAGLPRLTAGQLRSLALWWSPGDPAADPLAKSVRQRPASPEIETMRRRLRRSMDPDIVRRLGDVRRHLVGIGRAPSTIASYLGALDRAERYFARAGSSLLEAEAEQLVEYAALLPRDRSTRSLTRSALRVYFAVHGRSGDLARAIRVPSKPPMRSRALDPNDAAALACTAASWSGPAGVAVLLGLYLGLRRFEIAQLRFDDFADGWLSLVGKGERQARLPVPDQVSRAVGSLSRTSIYLFPGTHRGHVHPATVWSWVDEVARSAGLGHVTTHQLRHTALTVANDATGDLRAVQEFARHARPETTAGYTRVNEARLRRIGAAISYPQVAAAARGSGDPR